MSALILAFMAMVAADGAPAKSPGLIRHEEAVAASHAGRLSYYPERARRLRVAGRAVIDCLVEDGGWMTDCRLWSEKPPGWGFGAKALEMAPLFVLKAKPGEQRVSGARHIFPINVKLPG